MTSDETFLTFSRRPSAAWYMLGSLLPSASLNQEDPLPRIAASWHGVKVDESTAAKHRALSGLPPSGNPHFLCIHSISLRPQMAILTHPRFPLTIWRMFQVRNRIRHHRAVAANETLNIEVATASFRILEKGAEIDLCVAAKSGDQLVFDAVNSYYFRGNVKKIRPPQVPPQAPRIGEQVLGRWRMPHTGTWWFSNLTGDYNGIHQWAWYAKLLGFRGPLFHPQRVLGECLSRLPQFDESTPLTLESWLKGPVYYDSEVELRADLSVQDAASFGLLVGDEPRPAIVGRVRRGLA